MHFNDSYSVELSGFWQVHKYFIDHMEEIRRQLRFKQTILDRVNSFLVKTINRSISIPVGIHVRRGDFQRSNVLFTSDSFSAADYLATLTQCEHIILTVGTLGWWAAFLLYNRAGDVLTDSKVDHTPIDANCKRDDYFPPWFSFLSSSR